MINFFKAVLTGVVGLILITTTLAILYFSAILAIGIAACAVVYVVYQVLTAPAIKP